ncbi:MAG TPA: hypothetical protein VNQ77_14085 [Frankiaceae bacterium]|nr:hypothetical protein [Frankiaceae bacterium]
MTRLIAAAALAAAAFATPAVAEPFGECDYTVDVACESENPCYPDVCTIRFCVVSVRGCQVEFSI